MYPYDRRRPAEYPTFVWKHHSQDHCGIADGDSRFSINCHVLLSNSKHSSVHFINRRLIYQFEHAHCSIIFLFRHSLDTFQSNFTKKGIVWILQLQRRKWNLSRNINYLSRRIQCSCYRLPEHWGGEFPSQATCLLTGRMLPDFSTFVGKLQLPRRDRNLSTYYGHLRRRIQRGCCGMSCVWGGMLLILSNSLTYRFNVVCHLRT